MKKFRITFKPPEADGRAPQVEEIVADNWRVDAELVSLYRREGEKEVNVFKVPKARILRIMEVPV